MLFFFSTHWVLSKWKTGIVIKVRSDYWTRTWIAKRSLHGLCPSPRNQPTHHWLQLNSLSAILNTSPIKINNCPSPRLKCKHSGMVQETSRSLRQGEILLYNVNWRTDRVYDPWTEAGLHSFMFFSLSFMHCWLVKIYTGCIYVSRNLLYGYL